MNQFISCFAAGVLIVFSSVSATASDGPLPLPQDGYKVYSRIQFVDLTTQHPVRDKALGDTLEVSFKSQLDQLYRLHNPSVRNLQFVERVPPDVFHEFQKTLFPTQAGVSGRNLTLLFKGSIYRPTATKMYDLYKQSLIACEMRGGRVSTEKELIAVATLGDYGGGVSYWSVESSRVYVAPWSQSTSATSLNPTEQLNYLCVR